jgi:hypothetical protein
MVQTPTLETIETPKESGSTTYHGVTVTEDYRWLEDAGSDQVQSWTVAQHRRTRGYLENLPFYGAVRKRAAEILKAESVRYDGLARAGSAYFALKHQPPKQQPFLVMLSNIDDVSDERVLVDPNEIDDSGSTTIDWYQASPDGRLVAVSLSSRGTEDGTVHVYEATSGELTGVTVPRVNGVRRAVPSPGPATPRASGTPATHRLASGRKRTSTSTRRSGSTHSATRLRRTAASCRLCSPTTGSRRTSSTPPPMGCG